MAIPNRTTLTCPRCGASEDVVIADSSVGPQGQVSPEPIYSMAPSPLWSQSERDGVVYLSCTSCGAPEFTTLARAARGRGLRRFFGGGSVFSPIRSAP